MCLKITKKLILLHLYIPLNTSSFVEKRRKPHNAVAYTVLALIAWHGKRVTKLDC